MRRDLRLYAFAGAVWLAALAGLYVSARAGVLVAAGAAALAGLLSVRRLATVPARWVLVAGLLGAVGGAAGTAARVAVRDEPPLARLVTARATVTVGLTISDDPRPLRGSGTGPQRYAVPAGLHWLSIGSGRVDLSAGVLVLATDPSWRALLPGTPVTASGRLVPAGRGDLRAALITVTGPPDRTGSAPWFQRAAGTLRAGLRRACAPLPPEPRGLLPGLVIGDTSRLDPTVAADFKATGLTHLVAVSGANLAIVGGLVLALARWCRAGPRLAAGLCAAALLGFVILARPSPSVLRAAAMGGLGVLALAVGRPRAAVPALAAGVAALLIADPELAGDAGFALSVSATGGLLLIAPRWRDALRRHRVPAGLAEALAVPAAAQVACAPVIAGLSGAVSLVAVPANLLAEPAVAPATVLGVLAAVLSVPWPGGAAFVAWLASWPARWLIAVASHGAGVPAGALPWPGGTGGALLLAAVLVGLGLATRRPRVRLVAAVCAIAAALGAVPVSVVAAGWPPDGALIVVCDIGQGDAIVLPLAPGQAVVVDTGPEPAATDRCLRSLGIDDVPLLVLTHFHADHVGGVDGLYRGRRVAAVLISPFPEPVAGHDAVLAAAASHGSPVSIPAPGWTWRAGRLRLYLLGPAHRLAGTDSDPNNNSLVLRAEVDGERILLAGDAEVEEQADVLASLGTGALRADVLKVPHHGSAKQDWPFVAAVDPAVALVSVGAHNVYGLPNVPVLDRLRRDGAEVLRTDLDGDLAAVRVGGHLAVVRHPLPAGVPP